MEHDEVLITFKSSVPKISGHCQFVVSAVANDLRSFGQDSCDCHAGLSGAAINACDSGRCIVEGIRWWLIGCHRHPRLQIGQWHLRPQHADGLPDGRSEAPVRVRAPESDDHHGRRIHPSAVRRRRRRWLLCRAIPTPIARCGSRRH